MNPIFKPLSKDDLPLITAIENHVKQDAWKKQQFEECFVNSLYQCFGLFDGDRLLGYAILMKVSDEAELLNICVDKEYQGKGWGEKLLGHAINTVNAKKIFLEVRASNFSAIKLYEKCEFTQISVRKKYYQHPSEDALILQRESI
jgi:ribosomal-protein-alanine N-acetyltransferase